MPIHRRSIARLIFALLLALALYGPAQAAKPNDTLPAAPIGPPIPCGCF